MIHDNSPHRADPGLRSTAGEEADQARGSLSGLMVVDLSTGIAAPTATMLLADHGATVVSIERPGSPSMNRIAGWRIGGTSAWWYLLGRNKHALTLDLKDPRGITLLKRLVDRADVLVENFRPGKLEALGLAPETLHEDNPGLVVMRLSGWGQTGPYAGNPAYGSLAEAMSGLVYGTGDPDRPPVLSSFAIADPVAGYLGAFALMTALWARERDPEHQGEIIDVALLEAQFSLLGPQAMAYDSLGLVQERTGSRSPTFAPRNVYSTQDGQYVALSATAQNIVNRCFVAIGCGELRDDPRFATPEARFRHQDELDQVFERWIAAKDRDEVLAVLRAADATIAPVYSIVDILGDEHFSYREMVVDVPVGDMRTVKQQNVVPKLANRPGRIRWAGRPVGSANEQWFGGILGLDAGELERLHKDGVI